MSQSVRSPGTPPTSSFYRERRPREDKGLEGGHTADSWQSWVSDLYHAALQWKLRNLGEVSSFSLPSSTTTSPHRAPHMGLPAHLGPLKQVRWLSVGACAPQRFLHPRQEPLYPQAAVGAGAGLGPEKESHSVLSAPMCQSQCLESSCPLISLESEDLGSNYTSASHQLCDLGPVP